jgi:hypothetical protein
VISLAGIGTALVTILKDEIMKTKEPNGKDIIVYRKDGKTPDLRYKSSRDYVASQHKEKDKDKKQDLKPFDLRNTGLRDHVLLHQTEKLRMTPVQIKPAGKKPVWKISK